MEEFRRNLSWKRQPYLSWFGLIHAKWEQAIGILKMLPFCRERLLTRDEHAHSFCRCVDLRATRLGFLRRDCLLNVGLTDEFVNYMHSLREFRNLSTGNAGNKDCFIPAIFTFLTSWATTSVISNNKCHQLSITERAQKKKYSHLNRIWHHLCSITEQMHNKMESIFKY